jgi:hypothetical protein
MPDNHVRFWESFTMTELFNYRRPQDATRTLNKLREEFPHMTFQVVPSALPAYPFRHVIKMFTQSGAASFVKKCRWADMEDSHHVPYSDVYRYLNLHVCTSNIDVLREARRRLKDANMRNGFDYREQRKIMYRCMLYHHRKAQELVWHFRL